MQKEGIKVHPLKLQAKLTNKNKFLGYKTQYIIKIIIVETISGIIIGLFVGYFIDKNFPIFPFFTILFLIIGCFASILNIYTNLYIKKHKIYL